MTGLRRSVSLVSLMVMAICIYSFLGGNKVFEGKFENDYIAWYFLAKGLFCSVALYLLVLIVEKVQKP